MGFASLTQRLFFHLCMWFVVPLEKVLDTTSGWQSPLFDVALDTAGNRVVLALSDGDVLVYSTQRGKSKARKDMASSRPH